MEKLSERKTEILFAVVENYIATAEPVGSSQVAKIKGISLSSATIRHVMSELEELGFLGRPHTSAGGVPTNRAYRFYVDQLMHLKPLSSKDKEEIRTWIQAGTNDPNRVLHGACRLISEKANQPGLALAPVKEERSLKHIQFMKLNGNVILAILVTSFGIVENKLLQLDCSYSQEQLNRMHNYLNSTLCGKAIGQVRKQILEELGAANKDYDDLLKQAFILGEQALSNMAGNVHIEGQSRILSEPEFSNVDRMQQILRTLEEKTEILRLLDQSVQNPGIKIFIGSEIDKPEINGLSFITSTYSDAEGNRGVLGVIGPTRMAYSSIVPLVDFTSQIVTEVLGEMTG